MTHLEKAENLLHQKYHCSQALFGAFADDLNIDIKTAFKSVHVLGEACARADYADVLRLPCWCLE